MKIGIFFFILIFCSIVLANNQTSFNCGGDNETVFLCVSDGDSQINITSTATSPTTSGSQNRTPSEVIYIGEKENIKDNGQRLHELIISSDTTCNQNSTIKFETLDEDGKLILINSSTLYINGEKYNTNPYLSINDREYFYLVEELPKGNVRVRITVEVNREEFTQFKTIFVEECVGFWDKFTQKTDEIILSIQNKIGATNKNVVVFYALMVGFVVVVSVKGIKKKKKKKNGKVIIKEVDKKRYDDEGFYG